MILILQINKDLKHIHKVLNLNNKKKLNNKVRINIIRETLVYKQKIIIYFQDLNMKIMVLNK